MDLAELLEHDLDPVTAEQKIGNWFRTLEGCLPQEGVFYVSDAYLWAVELAVLADTGRKSQLEGIWERELRNLQQKHANVRSFPYRALTEHFGEEKAFSPKMWYMGKVLWGMEMQSALAEQILYRAALEYRTPKRCWCWIWTIRCGEVWRERQIIPRWCYRKITVDWPIKICSAY